MVAYDIYFYGYTGLWVLDRRCFTAIEAVRLARLDHECGKRIKIIEVFDVEVCQ